MKFKNGLTFVGFVFAVFGSLAVLLYSAPAKTVDKENRYNFEGEKIELTKSKPNDEYFSEIRLQVEDAIKEADDRLYISAYEIGDTRIISLLTKKAKSGVSVYAISDTNYYQKNNKKYDTFLRSGGHKIYDDRSSTLIHSKLVVSDSDIFLLSTNNYTKKGVSINSGFQVGIYNDTFAIKAGVNQFKNWINGKFGSSQPGQRVYQSNDYKIVFSPDWGENPIRDAYVQLISNRENPLVFSSFSFTDDQLFNIIYDTGEYRGYIDNFTAGSKYSINNKFPEKTSDSVNIVDHDGQAFIHEKVFGIVDNSVAIGSANFSSNGLGSNEEASIIIHKKELSNQLIGAVDKWHN